MNELTQGIAVVTGAGGGLGRALSVELSKSMQVAGIGRDQAALDEPVSDLLGDRGKGWQGHASNLLFWGQV